MAALKSQCPGCKKILKLKTKAALGKRVPCPQCSKPFIVEEYDSPEMVDDFIDDDEGETFDYASYEEDGGASAGYDDGYDDYDDYDDDGDDYDDYEAPKRKSSGGSSKSGGKSKSKKKTKKKKGAGMPPWLPLALMAGVGVAALAGIVGAIIAFVPFGSSNVIDLAWLPGDADGYVYIEPQEIWNAAVLAPLRENEDVKKAMTEIPNGPKDLKPTDNESITLAITGTKPAAGTVMANPFVRSGQKVLIVMRLGKSASGADLQEHAARKDYNGKEYYQAGMGPAMYLADPTTLLVGDEELLKAAIDQGPTEPRVEWMDFADSGHHFFMAMKTPTINTPSSDEVEQTVQKAKAGYVGVSFGSDVDVEAGLNCAAAGDADLLEAKIEETLAEAKEKMESQADQVPPQFASFVDIGKKVVNSVSASSSGSVLTVSVSVPGEIGPAIADLAKNPFAAMALGGMMNQGLAGFGGGSSPPGIGSGNPPMTTPGVSTPTSTGGTGGSSNPLTGALDAARRTQSKNNVKQLMVGVHNYHDVHKRFPQSAIVGPDGKTKHSWRVAMLPFIGQQALYAQYKLNEPWDSPANQQVMNRMPAAFRHPNDLASSTNTAYFGLVGPDTAMGDSSKQTGLRDVTDGSSNTVFLVEAKRRTPWTKPEDIPYATGSPVPQLGGHHNGGFHVGLADGSSRFLSTSLDQNTLRNLFNRKDGNVIGQF